MYTQAAETMWTNLTEKLSDMNHVLTLAKYGLESFLVSFYARKILIEDSYWKYFILLMFSFRKSSYFKDNLVGFVVDSFGLLSNISLDQ